MAGRVLKAFVFFTVSFVFVKATCDEYGVGEVSDCTDGFPTLIHIDKVSIKLETRDKRQVLIPDINFTCNGTITRWIVGAEWEGDNTPAYTELQIWRMSSNNEYIKIAGTNIIVGSENVSEVYEIENQLTIQEGDIFGYFQPKKGDSELNLCLEKSDRITTYHINVDDDLIPPAIDSVFQIDQDTQDTRYPLIAVRTNPPDCSCGFMSEERVYALNNIPLLNTGMRRDFDNRQMIFPDITFTCDGDVVKWIMAGKWNDPRNQFPELQIWRLSQGTTYTKQSGTSITADNKEDDDIYEYTLTTPLPFQSGDILGILQPHRDDSKLQVRYDDGGYSVYHHTDADVNNDIFDISGNGVTTETDIPLVTVVIVPSVELMSSISPSSRNLQSSLIITSNSNIKETSSSITSASITTSITANVEDVISSTISRKDSTTVVTGNPSSTANQEESTTVITTTTTGNTPTPHESSTTIQEAQASGGLDSGDIVGIVLSLIIILLLIAVTAIIIIFITRKRKKHSLKTEGVNNPSYGDVITTGGAAKYTKNTETVEVYSNPYDDVDIDLYAVPDAAQHYESPMLKALETSQEWGVYVPTEHQRTLYQDIDDIYSYPELKPVVRDGGGGDGTEGSFFTESDIYWVPASRPAELYEQLSKYRFREIPRGHIETEEHLGSGQFGTVNKGVWQCPRGNQNVAIKLLQKGATDDNHVKFLKEAAIMGQFSHPNIISLLGVVTLGEPVMLVMELMQNGDLRKNLLDMKPTPGELAPHSLYQQLLDFCQQISAGMTYLSKKAFVHRDIAARNILLSGKTCKIADFGMARDLEENAYYTSQGGQIPVKWTAPEALNYKKYSTASDVWSFGCLMYEIWSLGHKPFEGYTNVQTVHMVMSGWRLPPPPGSPKEIYSLMISCWHPEAGKRPHFSNILQALSRSEHDLLYIPEEVSKGHPQAAILGAPLEVTKDAYTDLQTTYTQ